NNSQIASFATCLRESVRPEPVEGCASTAQASTGSARTGLGSEAGNYRSNQPQALTHQALTAIVFDNTMQAIRHYLLAVQFFTRLPVTGRLADWVGYSPAMLRASAAHFPGVGWLVAA